ncbi:MAG: dolichyl-phosphate beta-glucosyltransferase [Planctomycetota bacterium]
MDAPRLSIVIPAYNEIRRLGNTLTRCRAYALTTGRRCEVVVVDDGSTDGTPDCVRTFTAAPLAIQLLTNETNRGKGHAVRRGMLAARGPLRLMCDADLSTPLEQLDRLAPWLERGYDVVIGSRDQPDSRLDPPQPRLRRWPARLFRAVRRRLLLPNLRDTQCGFKLFTADAACAIFARATVDGWLFDCEILGIAERLGFRIREAGVVWQNHPDTRVHALRTALTAIPELVAIRRRVRRLAVPEPPWAVPPAAPAHISTGPECRDSNGS